MERLSPEQRARIRANHARALQLTALRKQREQAEALAAEAADVEGAAEKKRKRPGINLDYCEFNLSRMGDTKAGFIADPAAGASFPIRGAAPTQTPTLNPNRPAADEPPINTADLRANPQCGACGSLNINFRYLDAFAVPVCGACIDRVPEKYSLLTKTECRQDYLLTEPELNDRVRLPRMERPNPHKSTWNSMLLFLRMQVEAFALEKWGTFDALDAEFARREGDKRDRRQKKFQTRLRELRKKTRTSTWRSSVGSGGGSAHEHDWDDASAVADPDSGMTRKTCLECGATILMDDL